MTYNATRRRAGEPEGMVRLALDVSAQPSAEERVVEVVASTSRLDREGEILEQDWRLEGVTSVPVFWEHNRAAGIGIDAYDPRHSMPIGFADELRVDAGALKGKLHFVNELANPLGPQVFELFRQGAVRSVSVGFTPGTVRLEQVGDEEVLVLGANELLEISACSIPVNPDAVAFAIGAKAYQHLREAAMRVKKSEATSEEAPKTDEKAVAADAPMACSNTDCKAANAPGSRFCSMCGKAFEAHAEPDGDEKKPSDGDGDEKPKALLELTGTKSRDEALAKVHGWKKAAELYEAAAAELAALKIEQREAEIAQLLEEGHKSGRLAPAQRSWALDLAGASNGKGADPKRLKALLAGLPKQVEIGGSGTKTPPDSSLEEISITPEQRAVNKQLGITDEQFTKSMKARQKPRAGA